MYILPIQKGEASIWHLQSIQREKYTIENLECRFFIKNNKIRRDLMEGKKTLKTQFFDFTGNKATKRILNSIFFFSLL